MPYKDKNKRNAYQNNRMKALRTAWLFSNGPCCFCGGNENLQVDHINPAVKVSHRIWSWSESRRSAELSKCQVLCKECNQYKAAVLNMTPKYHGTDVCYRKRGCRCLPCTKAHAAAKRIWDSKKRFAIVAGE